MTFWIVWRVGPFASGLRDVQISTVLPAGVQATGKFASAQGGTFSTDKKMVRWSIDELAQGQSAPADFAFEVSLTPTLDNLASTITLLRESQLHAISVLDGQPLAASAAGDTTDLPLDSKGKGRGTVTR
jgi:hypothetical protein